MNTYIVEHEYTLWEIPDMSRIHDRLIQGETVEEALEEAVSKKCSYRSPCTGSKGCIPVYIYDGEGRELWSKVDAGKVLS